MHAPFRFVQYKNTNPPFIMGARQSCAANADGTATWPGVGAAPTAPPSAFAKWLRPTFRKLLPQNDTPLTWQRQDRKQALQGGDAPAADEVAAVKNAGADLRSLDAPDACTRRIGDPSAFGAVYKVCERTAPLPGEAACGSCWVRKAAADAADPLKQDEVDTTSELAIVLKGKPEAPFVVRFIASEPDVRPGFTDSSFMYLELLQPLKDSTFARYLGVPENVAADAEPSQVMRTHFSPERHAIMQRLTAQVIATLSAIREYKGDPALRVPSYTQFGHNDLHANNVMVVQSGTEHHVLLTGEKRPPLRVAVGGTAGMAKIIDFGASKLDVDSPIEDFTHLFSTFIVFWEPSLFNTGNPGEAFKDLRNFCLRAAPSKLWELQERRLNARDNYDEYKKIRQAIAEASTEVLPAGTLRHLLDDPYFDNLRLASTV